MGGWVGGWVDGWVGGIGLMENIANSARPAGAGAGARAWAELGNN